MQAYFQGRIDNFCAVYAVLNALQVLFGLPPLAARRIYNRTLIREAADPAGFRNVLEHRTDYVRLVDGMIGDVRTNEFPGLRAEAPFPEGASCVQVWEALRGAASPPVPKISVFRFLRFSPDSERPYVDHWTTGHFMDGEGLHLLDCSLEPGALYSIPFSMVTDIGRPMRRDYVVIPPESVRILSAAASPAMPL